MVAQPVERRLDLFPRQRRFVLDPARFPLYIGGLGSGKSFAGAAKIVVRINRKEVGLVGAPTYPMLRDATQRTLFGMLDDLGIRYVHHKSENRMTVPRSGHEVLFRSLDNPETLRGPNLNYAWIDEISLASELAWQIIKGRVRIGWQPQAWATGTPKGRNHVWTEWERDANPDHPVYRVRTDENPTLPPGFAESLGYVGAFAAQELGGEFVAFEGLVYPGFSRVDHVCRVDDLTGWRTILGVDVGSRNPTAILTIRIAADGERFHVQREFYRRGMSSREIVAAIETEADDTKPETIYIDPSAKAYIDDLLVDGYPAEKANNDVLVGVQRVATAIADGLTVNPSCVNLIAEFESYHFPENKRESDNPAKGNEHCLDALRYSVLGEAEPMTGLPVLVW